MSELPNPTEVLWLAIAKAKVATDEALATAEGSYAHKEILTPLQEAQDALLRARSQIDLDNS